MNKIYFLCGNARTFFRNNETVTHDTPESIYLSTIKYEKQVMG